jgi:hypothetical protein
MNAQDKWAVVLEYALEHMAEAPTTIRSYVPAICQSANVPRQQKKFINFAKNSVRLHSPPLLEELWNFLDGCKAKCLSEAEPEPEAAPMPVVPEALPSDVKPADDKKEEKKSKKKKKNKEGKEQAAVEEEIAVEEVNDEKAKKRSKKKKDKKEDDAAEAATSAKEVAVVVEKKDKKDKKDKKKDKKKRKLEEQEGSGEGGASKKCK